MLRPVLFLIWTYWLIETELCKEYGSRTVGVLDVGSAPHKRINAPAHVSYHSICPMYCAEDPCTLQTYAAKLTSLTVEESSKVADRDSDLKDVLENLHTPESETICLNDMDSCKPRPQSH